MHRSLAVLTAIPFLCLLSAARAEAQVARTLIVEGSVLLVPSAVPGVFEVAQPGDPVSLSCRVELDGAPGAIPEVTVYAIDPASVIVSVGEESDVAVPGSYHRLGIEQTDPTGATLSIGGPLSSGVGLNIFGQDADGDLFPTNELSSVLGTYERDDFTALFMNIGVYSAGQTIMVAIDPIHIGVPGPELGWSYCDGVPNSTGVPSRLSAHGSLQALDNDLNLFTARLPEQAFGFFLVSNTQGFSPNPGGSSGNLCVAGQVGRFVGPGEIQQSGASGTFELAVDLTRLPRPNGFAPVVSGDVYFVQAWHRDVTTAGLPTSNLSNGLELGFL